MGADSVAGPFPLTNELLPDEDQGTLAKFNSIPHLCFLFSFPFFPSLLFSSLSFSLFQMFTSPEGAWGNDYIHGLRRS